MQLTADVTVNRLTSENKICN